jgi:hypothetical protein
MRLMKTISKLSPHVKTLGGLKQIFKLGTGTVLPRLSRLALHKKSQQSLSSSSGGGVRPLKFLI